MRKKAEFIYDAPLGIYRCEGLSDELIELAKADGPVFRYGSVPCRTLLGLETDDYRTAAGIYDPETTLFWERNPSRRVLVAQARVLLLYAGAGCPIELRASIPADFGRVKYVAWYHPILDNPRVPVAWRVPEISWEEIENFCRRNP